MAVRLSPADIVLVGGAVVTMDDLVVLDRDLYAADRRTIGDARVLLTLVEGEVVHEDPALERG